MEVRDNKGELIGFCSVAEEKLVGRALYIPIANETDLCQVCGLRHTSFSNLVYPYGWIEGKIHLVAASRSRARHLPGFQAYAQEGDFILKREVDDV